mgnify:CR=1 FL=1
MRFLLPVDHIVAPKLEAGSPAAVLTVGDEAIGDRMGLDIGPETIRQYTAAIRSAKTVIWNGPMGVFEIDAFAKGTEAVARAIAANTGFSIAGGGETITAIEKYGIEKDISYISTGGGALGPMPTPPSWRASPFISAPPKSTSSRNRPLNA